MYVDMFVIVVIMLIYTTPIACNSHIIQRQSFDTFPENGLKRCQVYHNNIARDVPCKQHQGTPDFPVPATILETTDLPKDPRLMPEVGNGHIATVVQGDSIYMNGLYNGANTSSHRARIQSTVSAITQSVTKSTRKYQLDLARGIFIERYDGDGFYIEIRTYAHRVLTRLLVVEIEMSRKANQNVSISFKLNNGKPSPDIKYEKSFRKDSAQTTIKRGRIKEPEFPSVVGRVPVAVVYDTMPTFITIPTGISSFTVYFFTSISLTSYECLKYYNQGNEMILNNTVLSSHVAAWADIWNKGRIDVEGNDEVARLNYASLYYLMSSLPTKPDPENWIFWGLSPCGLAHGDAGKDYYGHIFWDQDTWMFPPVMMLHANVGKFIVESRKLAAAQYQAEHRGYRGAMFPWETAFTGLDVDKSVSTDFYEIHISADVSFAFRQYLFLTNDTDFFLNESGAEILMNVATFWASFAYFNPKINMYEINNVTGPDEYNVGVNNSVYTNIAAGISLQSGQMAAKLLGKEPPELWQDILDKLYIPLDKSKMYHPEFDGYKPGIKIKQADTILIGFPLMYKYESSEIRINDLTVYEQAISNGPAMTWSLFAVNWLELGNYKQHADDLFKRGYKNSQKPFYIWTENADGSGAVNFHTGMGGFLQSVLFGYGGFRILEDNLTFDPQMLPSTSRWNITGLDYLGNSLDFSFEEQKMWLTLTNARNKVTLYLTKEKITKTLTQTALVFPIQKAEIHVVST